MLQFLCEDAANGGENKWMTWVFVGLLVVLVAALLIVPMFTNKKRAKQDNERYNSLRPGDVIKTVGGIIGTIIEIRQVSPTEREMVIETGVGDNKTTMVFDIQALYQIMSKTAAPEAPAAPATETAPADEAVEKTDEAPAAVEQPEVTEAPVTENVTEPETVATVSEEPTAVEDAAAETAEVPVKNTTKSSAGKSTHAGKSSSAGKSTTKKTTKK